MTDVWFVLVPQASQMNAAGVVADAFVVEVAQGSTVANQLTANYAGKVTVGGKSGYLRAGPFTSAAAAAAYLKVGAQNATTPVPGVDITPSGGITAANPIPGVSAFFAALGDSNTWIRVAKVIVGGVLLIVGLVHITGAENAVASAARKVPLPI